ncbi:MAG TPA: sarcosine oxidase subunit gamma family protein [Steroidobacteraceae bacterium]|nr:sarcosine oxidase subunit gamma family protein [Steroidobacteraceae bacterium]
MSAPEVTLASCCLDVVEVSALRGASDAVAACLAAREVTVPQLGQLTRAPGTLALGCRPDRTLLLSVPTVPGAAAAQWREACGARAAVVDLSSALSVLHLGGGALREALARGCRLDLDPGLFPAGRVAATIIAQVATILAALPAGMLILTPASTARHWREWLAAAARPFGYQERPDLDPAALCGDVHS